MYYLPQAHSDMDYIVRDKLVFERIIGMEFLEPTDKSLFYNGNDFSAQRAVYFNWVMGTFVCGYT